MAGEIQVRRLAGDALGPWLDAVARLRIAVFRDWPYLYAGDLDYERGYLQAYARSPDSVFVLAFDGDAVVGASTGLPLADDTDQFQRPFRDAGRAVDGAGVQQAIAEAQGQSTRQRALA